MAIPTFNAVGFCAHYSKQGDWAFDYALRLSRTHSIQLNVFHFLTDPYRIDDDKTKNLDRDAKARLAIEREKELRMYYDKRAGDYLDVGFRLCEDAEWVELHKCLLIREFQVLVLAYVGSDARFGGRPVEDFAEAFVCPVILVGPEKFDQFRLNKQAGLLISKLGLDNDTWDIIERISA